MLSQQASHMESPDDSAGERPAVVTFRSIDPTTQGHGIRYQRERLQSAVMCVNRANGACALAGDRDPNTTGCAPALQSEVKGQGARDDITRKGLTTIRDQPSRMSVLARCPFSFGPFPFSLGPSPFPFPFPLPLSPCPLPLAPCPLPLLHNPDPTRHKNLGVYPDTTLKGR